MPLFVASVPNAEKLTRASSIIVSVVRNFVNIAYNPTCQQMAIISPKKTTGSTGMIIVHCWGPLAEPPSSR